MNCRLSKIAFALIVLAAASCGCFSAVEAQTGKSKGKSKAKASDTAANNPAVQEAQRGDWSRWRGPKGDGISYETGLLDSWPADGPPLLWRSKGLGSGYSSVAVAGGKIFTMGDKNSKDHIVCLNVDDGSVLWSTP